MAGEKTSLQEQVREVIAEVLGMTPNELADDAGVDTVAAWTSLQHLSIIAAIEERFGIQMEMDEMGTATTLTRLTDVVSRHTDGG